MSKEHYNTDSLTLGSDDTDDGFREDSEMAYSPLLEELAEEKVLT